MNTNTLTLTEMLFRFRAEVDGFVEEADRSDVMVMRLMLYRNIWTLNFLPWMADVWVRCQSDIAKRVCQNNLQFEVDRNRPAMLQRYVDQSKQAEVFEVHTTLVRQADARHYALQPAINTLESLLKQTSVGGLLILAALESASFIFIPEMKRWGDELKFTDFEYVKVCGEVNDKRVNALTEAVEAEARHLKVCLNEVTVPQVLCFVSEILRGIFRD